MSMKITLIRGIIGIAMFLMIFLLVTQLDRTVDKSADAFTNSLGKIDAADVAVITLVVRYSDRFERGKEIRLTEAESKQFTALLNRKKQLDNLYDRLLPSEIYECRIKIDNDKEFCFEIINSKSYGTVLSFYSGCFNGLHIGKMTVKKDMLSFVHQKFSK